MTVLFPRSDDPLLVPYVEPMGRMMLAYGRAMVALRAIAETVLGDEAKAVAFMRDVKTPNLVEKMSKLCASTYTPDRLADLRTHCTTLVELYIRRNRIVHGQWWFNHGELLVRDWEAGEAVHEKVTPETLERLACDFVEVSSDLDMLTYTPPE